MINDKETCCFLHIVKNVLSSDGYYLLPVKDYGDIQPDKVFMGYYYNKCAEEVIAFCKERSINCHIKAKTQTKE